MSRAVYLYTHKPLLRWLGRHGSSWFIYEVLTICKYPGNIYFAIGVEGNTKICYLNLKTTVERPKASYRSRNFVLFSKLRKSQKFI